MADEPIDIEKLTLFKILSAITLSQAYKLCSTLTIMLVAVFCSGYQTSEYMHKEEKYKAEMFQAITEMWEASNIHASSQNLPRPKLPLPVIHNNSQIISNEDVLYLNARDKLQNAVQSQNSDIWEIKKDNNGQPILYRKYSNQKFLLPCLDQNIHRKLNRIQLAKSQDDAHIDILNGEQTISSQNYNYYISPFILPIMILLIVWFPILKRIKQN